MSKPGQNSRPAASSAGSASSFNYFKESRQPIYSALLVLPFLLIYEIGLLLLRSDVINGGDAILINLGAPWLRRIGVDGSLISVVCLGVCFIVWQIWHKGRWSFQWPTLIAMFFESLLYAIVLFMLLGFFVQYLSDSDTGITGRGKRAAKESVSPVVVMAATVTQRAELIPCARQAGSGPGFRDFILFCGAGVFEELVFRALLLSLLLLVLTKMLHMEHMVAGAWSVIIGAIIFSAFHHIGGEKFEVNVFMQRLLAGLYFSALYYNRSFGIAAASHALYDILVGLNQLR